MNYININHTLFLLFRNSGRNPPLSSAHSRLDMQTGLSVLRMRLSRLVSSNYGWELYEQMNKD